MRLKEFKPGFSADTLTAIFEPGQTINKAFCSISTPDLIRRKPYFE